METPDHRRQAPIVAAFSPASGARESVEFGLAASRLTGAPLIVAVVVDTGSLTVHFGADEAPVLPAGIAEPVSHLERDLRAAGVDVEVRPFEDSTPARGLARAIDEFGPELVVIGSSDRGPKGAILMGTTAHRVIHASACPVAVVPNGYRRPEGGVAVVGVAYTSTPEGEDALRAAAALSRTAGVRLRTITVVDGEDAGDEARAAVSAKIEEVASGIDVHTDIAVGDAADGIVAASANVDLLVMGSRALGAHRAVVLGSVSRRVIDRAGCPVLVIPRGSAQRTEELLGDAAAQTPKSAE